MNHISIVSSIILVSQVASAPCFANAHPHHKHGKQITPHRQFVAQRIKTYKHKSNRIRLAQANNSKSKTYFENIRNRIEESWGTYNIDKITARVSVRINKSGVIESTKLVNSTGDKIDAKKTIEAIKYATPFGKPPGGAASTSILVSFRHKRVSIGNDVSAKPIKSSTNRNKKTKKPNAATAIRKVPKVEIVRSKYSTNNSFNAKQEAKDLLDYLSN